MIIFIKSIFIGIFAIFPGISGSALAISLGLYDRIFYSFKNIKNNLLFIITVLLGLMLGIIIGSNIIIYFVNLNNYLYYIFIGLMISEIPFMINKTRSKGKIRYIYTLGSFLFSMIPFLFIKNVFSSNSSFIKMAIGGFLFSFGKVFPGVSSSFFLILLGIYKDIMILFSNPILIINNFFHFLPFLLGIILGLVTFIKLLNYLLINRYDYLYSVLIGFMISSIISIFPKFEINLMSIIGVNLMILSSVISFKLHRKNAI